MREQINELDQYPFRITFQDVAGQATTPTTLRWKLDCVTTRTSIIEWTDLTPGSTVNATVPASANAIVYTANDTETKRITVQANAGTDQQVNETLEYDVVNNFAYAS